MVFVMVSQVLASVFVKISGQDRDSGKNEAEMMKKRKYQKCC